MNKIKLLLGASLFASILMITPVMAEQGSGTATSPPATKVEDSTPASTPVAAETPKDLVERKTRLEDNITRLKTKLSDSDKKRLTTKCKPSQALVGPAGKSVAAIAENRAKAFTKISASVQKLIDRFKANGKDTTELEADLKVAQIKADTLAADFKAFDQALTDLKAMDCVADPTAFQAALDTARTERETAKTAAADLRTYITTTLRPAIEKLKTELEATEKTTEKTTDTTTPPTTTTPTTKTTGGSN